MDKIKDQIESSEYLNLKEATFDEKTGKARVLIIQEGFNVSQTRYYTKEALEKGAHLFAGKKMYANHEDDWKTRERGARDVFDWVASIESTDVGITESQKTGVFGNILVHDTRFKNKLKELKEAKQLGQMGVSIVAYSDGERKDMNGVMTNVVNEFIKASSVDFVAEPGAGGHVKNFKESKEGKESMEIKDLTVEKLKESNPDLLNEIVKTVTAQVKESIQAEAEDKQADQNKESDNDSARDTDHRFNVREAALDRKELLSSILAKNSLPENAKERVRESVLNTDVKMSGDRLDVKATKESIGKIIESEEAYIKEFSSAKVEGNGDSAESKEGAKVIESLQGFLDNRAGIEIVKETK